MPGALPVLAVALLLVLVAGWGLGLLNGLTGLRELVGESWRQVDEELGRRHELIPRLAQTVLVQAPDAAGVVDAVLVARATAADAERPGERGHAEAVLTAALDQVFALAATRPVLAAEPDYLALERELRGTEDRIAAGRRHYNDAVQVLNGRARRLPARLVARALGIRSAEPFGGGPEAAAPVGPEVVRR